MTANVRHAFLRVVYGHSYWEFYEPRPRVLFMATSGAGFVHVCSANTEVPRLFWTRACKMMVASVVNFFNQVHCFPTMQLHSSHAFNTSKILPIHTSVSLEQSTGSNANVDEAILFKQSLQVRIHEALRLGDTKMTINLLGHLGSIEDTLTSEDWILFLDRCRRFPDPEYALELWKLMDEKNLEIKQSGYLCILHALTKDGYLDEALYLLKSLGESSSGKAGLHMYDIFLNGCSKYHSLVHAKSCLELIENRSIGKSEATYIELMKLAVHGQNISALKQVWEDYNKLFPASVLSFQTLIWAFCKMGASVEANEALQRMILVVFKEISSQLSQNKRWKKKENSQCKELKVRIPVPYKKFDEPETKALSKKYVIRGLQVADCLHVSQMDLLSVHPCKHFKRGGRYKLKATVLYTLRDSFNNVIRLAASTRNYKMAELLFFQMDRLRLKPLKATYNAYLNSVIRERGVILGKKVVCAMKSKNVKPNNITYEALAVGYIKNRQIDQAEAMLEHMEEKKPQHLYPFNSLLTACCRADEPEMAIRVIKRMRRVNVKPNQSTYEKILFIFGTVNVPYERGDQKSKEAVSKRIAAIEMDMMRNGVEHSRKSIKNLLKAFAAEGMIKDLVHHLNDLEDRFNDSESPLLCTNIYNVVLHGLVSAKEWELAIDIFEKMKSFGIKPNKKTYTIMVDCYSINSDFNSARQLVNTMLQCGFKHHARTSTSIMKILLAKDEFEKALDFLNEMKEDGIYTDVIVYNTIIRQASRKVRFDVIELAVEHMHRQKIKPDPQTCLQVFFSYYDHGFFDTAVEALQVLSVRMVSENKAVQKRMKNTYEKLVLDESPSVDESLIEIFKDPSRVYLSASLFNMRLCAFTGVSNSWFPEESPWAIRLRSQYDQSPFVGQ